MYSRHLVVFGVVQLLLTIYIKSTSSFKVESQKIPQLDSSGWRTIDVSPTIKTSDEQQDKRQKDINNVRLNSHFVVKNRKLIEWDDDDNSSGSSSLVIPYEDFNNQRIIPKLVSTTLAPGLYTQKKWSRKVGKLIYHGQVKENGTSRIVDGIKLHINTHKPLTISRNRYQTFGSPLETSSSKTISDSESLDELSFRALGELKTKSVPKSKFNNRHVDPSLDIVSVNSAGSDWRPIVVNSRPRRADKMKARSESMKESNGKLLNENQNSSSKWRPLTMKRNEIINLLVPDSPSETSEKQKAIEPTRVSPQSIEEPFEDDGFRRESFVLEPIQMRTREPKSMNKTVKLQDNKWKPVDTTTLTPLYDLVDSPTTTSPSTTTILSATPIISPGIGNHSESAQRSASDLNYIYSSQQQPSDWLTASTSRQSSGYYPSASYSAAYGMQPSIEQQQPSAISQPAIIDTVSGQTPEMIEPRMPDTAILPMSEYSLPQTSATFQPAQAPPIRQQQPIQAAYSYDTYAGRIPIRQQVAVSASPTPTVSPNQFVRQEHHYHYYNQHQQQQQQQLPERQQIQPASVIREIQPLLISQPIIQQQPSSTPSPPPPPAQIIREIIKEVPMPIPQVPRIIIPAPPPPPPSPAAHTIHIPQGTRELESSYSYAAPAHRFMRQISNSIPVAMSMRQIRLPMPTIQLPVRLALSNPAPVTRQTGSYIIPPMPQKTTTYLTETQAMPTHTTIMHTTQFTPATRTTVYTTDHQPNPQPQSLSQTSAYKR